MVKSVTELPAIGILGGTFDPVHFGHLRPALDVMQALNLQQIRLIPSAAPPHRPQPAASAAQRRLMLELAIKDVPEFVVDDRELQRSGPSFSLDTLLSLRQDFADNPLFFLMGSDALRSIDSWSRWQQLLSLTHIVVMQRPDESLNLSTELQDWYQQHLAASGDHQLKAGKIWPVEVTQLAISATRIRADLAVGKQVRFLLPDAVISLINQLGLYR